MSDTTATYTRTTFAALLEILHASYWAGTMSARGYVLRLPAAQKAAHRERAFLVFVHGVRT